MKTIKFFAAVILLFAFSGREEAFSQWDWTTSPPNMWNTNSGNVGIGNNAPAKLLYVGKNMAEPTITVRNFGGAGGATFQMIDDLSQADWKFKAAGTGAFKIRDNYNGIDAVTIEKNAAANSIYIKNGGKIGVLTSNPSANLHVAETASPGYTGIFGTPLSTYTTGTNVSIGDDNANSYLYIGQSNSIKGYLGWLYNSDPEQSLMVLGPQNGLGLQLNPESIGNVKIGFDVSGSAWSKGMLWVGQYGYSVWNECVFADVFATAYCYINHGEDTYDDGNSSFRASRGINTWYIFENDGTAYSVNGSNRALEGYSSQGDQYSFGTAGFNNNDYTRCGGVLGSISSGSYWGSLGYKNSGGNSYGGYFSSYTSGGGKAGGEYSGIGLAAWGDLMGADIHGKIYGAYLEGENYALFTDGSVYKNGMDVHLQDNGNGSNTVMYTSVSTDMTVQTSGTAVLSSGKASISFDPAFAAVVSSSEPVIVTVTPLGESNGVYLTAVTNTGFNLAENNAGKSNVTVNYIAVGKRAGFEKPQPAKEVISPDYLPKLSRGLHPDADLQSNGETTHYRSGELIVGGAAGFTSEAVNSSTR
jgi:hypothetical protein